MVVSCVPKYEQNAWWQDRDNPRNFVNLPILRRSPMPAASPKEQNADSGSVSSHLNTFSRVPRVTFGHNASVRRRENLRVDDISAYRSV